MYTGFGSVRADEETTDFRSGDALLVPAGVVAHFASEEKAVLYRATVPRSK
ncbi:MAG: hypothetical protein JNK79_17320 [Chitinophagaceae bacterium]|nr:hypothetical protein [Chitinophagaceae bacterium]